MAGATRCRSPIPGEVVRLGGADGGGSGGPHDPAGLEIHRHPSGNRLQRDHQLPAGRVRTQADYLAVIDGQDGGTLVVSGFRPATDRISAQSYAAAPIIATGGGNTVLTFSDQGSGEMP